MWMSRSLSLVVAPRTVRWPMAMTGRPFAMVRHAGEQARAHRDQRGITARARRERVRLG